MRPGNLPQAFPYQGSKRKLAPVIVECIPPGTARLIEPFAGSAAISVAAAIAGRASRFWLNDKHFALIGLWRRILHDSHGLSADYERIWNTQHGREPEHYNEIRQQFNATQQPELLLFLLARCVKAAIRYSRNGQFNNSPDHRRKGMRPSTMGRNLKLIAELLGPDTRLTSGDYRTVLQEASHRDTVYLDPPYQGVCKDRDSRYVDGVLFDEFVAELQALNQREVPFIVSYDGRTGDKSYGQKLPKQLRLSHTELHVGKSTQATLLGRSRDTFESLYLSESLVSRLGSSPKALGRSFKSRTSS